MNDRRTSRPANDDLRASQASDSVRVRETETGISPVFILGCPRSGTTLLSAMLDRHSRIAVSPETHFYTSYLPTHEKHLAKYSDKELVDSIIGDWYLKDIGFTRDRLQVVLSEIPRGAASLFFALLCEFCRSQTKEISAEKTPNHLLHIDRILRDFPNAKIIAIVRDGRDVCLSKRTPLRKARSLRRRAVIWSRAVRVLRSAEQQHPQHIHRVHFEDLLTTPGNLLRGISSFIGVEYEPQQIDPNAGTTVVPDREQGWKGKATQTLDPGRIRAWEKTASPEQIRLMESAMRSELELMGYTESGLTTSFPVRLGHAIANVALRAVYSDRATALRAFGSRVLIRLKLEKRPEVTFAQATNKETV